jgi:hypothetical protein
MKTVSIVRKQMQDHDGARNPKHDRGSIAGLCPVQLLSFYGCSRQCGLL